MGIRIVIAFVLLAILGYGATEALPLLRGPVIVLESPAQYATSSDGFITLKGVAKNTETLRVDDQILLIDETGHFNTSLLFPPGGAILSLTATDRFGRTEHVRRTIYAL